MGVPSGPMIKKGVSVGGARVGMGACVGVAAYPQHGDTAAALLKAADEAMYRAKAAGKNDFRMSGFTSL